MDSISTRKRQWNNIDECIGAEQCKIRTIPRKQFRQSSTFSRNEQLSSQVTLSPEKSVESLSTAPKKWMRKEVLSMPPTSCGIYTTASSNDIRKNTSMLHPWEFLSRSLNRLNLTSTSTLAQQLYERANGSITSLIRARGHKRRLSDTKAKETHLASTSSASTISVKQVGHDSLRKSVWPIPLLEAVFLPQFPNKSNITEKDFAILNCIGCGSFGEVYRVCLKRELGVLFAMKKQQKSVILMKNMIQQVKNEASIHKSLSGSVFIARYYASWQSRTHLYTVLQYAMGYGDLFSLWRDYGPFGEDTLRIYAAEIAIAIDYIHRNNVIYRDLKLENVVLDLDGHIQIVDFGLSKWLADGERTATICGTLQFMAPEIANEKPYGKEVDWWSYGVLLHVLNTNRYPYPTCDATSHKELRYDSYSTPCCHPALGDFFNKLLNVNMEGRIRTFAQVKSHFFFDGIRWDEVELKKLMPFAHIEKLRRCPSCNSLYDKSVSDLSGTDVEENWAAFEEHYEFNNSDFFCDQLQ